MFINKDTTKSAAYLGEAGSLTQKGIYLKGSVPFGPFGFSIS